MKKYLSIFCYLLVCCSISVQANSQDNIDLIKEKIEPAMALTIEELQFALKIKVHLKFDGASIIAGDNENTFLGKIDSPYSMDSIFNSVGQHGSEVAMNSIWNSVGMFGSEVGLYSPFNSISSSPPLIIKNRKIIGYLTVNEVIDGAVDPYWLKSYYK